MGPVLGPLLLGHEIMFHAGPWSFSPSLAKVWKKALLISLAWPQRVGPAAPMCSDVLEYCQSTSKARAKVLQNLVVQ